MNNTEGTEQNEDYKIINLIQESLLLYMENSYKYSTPNLNFTWDVHSYTTTQITFNLTFEDATQVSMHPDFDIVAVEFLYPGMFFDSKGNLLLRKDDQSHQVLKITRPMPPQFKIKD